MSNPDYSYEIPYEQYWEMVKRECKIRLAISRLDQGEIAISDALSEGIRKYGLDSEPGLRRDVDGALRQFQEMREDLTQKLKETMDLKDKYWKEFQKAAPKQGNSDTAGQ